MRYDTPEEVASRLTRHAPRKIRKILDPSVGSGVLLEPLLERLKKQATQIICVDSDPKAISQVQSSFRSYSFKKLSCINADFLKWSAGRKGDFDCIVMNPPFGATKADLRKISLSRALQEHAGRQLAMPLEAAFLCRAIELLKDGGRLLAVLPASVIMAESSHWLRALLLNVGAVRMVHELPPRCFPTVESRMYLLIFDKGASQRSITLLNHDLIEPERMTISPADHRLVKRFDFGFQKANEFLRRLKRYKKFGWKSVGDVATVFRGNVKSPLNGKICVHTTDFHGGFWTLKHWESSNSRLAATSSIRRGDLLIKRVGRDCHKTVGPPISIVGSPCSDCILVIRPNNHRESMELQFSIQSILRTGWARPLLEKGTGASYISQKSLLELTIPMNLHERFPQTFARFVAAQRSKSSRNSEKAVLSAALSLCKDAGIAE